MLCISPLPNSLLRGFKSVEIVLCLINLYFYNFILISIYDVGNNLHGTLPEIEMENSTLVHLNIANNGLTGELEYFTI